MPSFVHKFAFVNNTNPHMCLEKRKTSETYFASKFEVGLEEEKKQKIDLRAFNLRVGSRCSKYGKILSLKFCKRSIMSSNFKKEIMPLLSIQLHLCP